MTMENAAEFLKLLRSGLERGEADWYEAMEFTADVLVLLTGVEREDALETIITLDTSRPE